MFAETGMYVAVNLQVNQRRKRTGIGGHDAEAGEGEVSAGLEADRGCSGISLGKEMNDAVDFRSIAYVPDFHIDIDEIFEPIHFNGQGRSVRKMIDKGRNFGEVDGFAENFFHK